MSSDNRIPYTTYTVKTDEGNTFELQDCASTAVQSFAWIPDAQELAVLFKSDDKTLYVYGGVTEREAHELETAQSKGTYIMREIKAKHLFRKEVIT